MCTVQLVWWTGNYFGTPCMLHIYTTKVRGLWYSSNFWCKQRSFVTQHTKMVVHNISLTLWPLLPFNYNAMRVYFCVPRYWPSFAMKIIEKRVINAWTLPFKMILILVGTLTKMSGLMSGVCIIFIIKFICCFVFPLWIHTHKKLRSKQDTEFEFSYQNHWQETK